MFSFIGPTGVGKTTSVAKIAARCVLRYGRNNVALLTTDTVRKEAVAPVGTSGAVVGGMAKGAAMLAPAMATMLAVLTTDAEAGRESREWLIEMSSPGNMTHLGWTHSSLKAGQHVAVSVSPLRDGMPGGACRTVTFLDDGKTMNCGLGASILAAEKPNIR